MMISESNITPLKTHNSKGNRNTSRNIKYLFHTNVCNFSSQLNIERLNKLHANSISGVEVVPCIILKYFKYNSPCCDSLYCSYMQTPFKEFLAQTF